MKLAELSKRQQYKAQDFEVSGVHENILMTLHMYGPMPIQELVEKNPQSRWVDVLRAVSQLWGEGKLELEHYKGQLKIWSTGEHDHVELLGEGLGKRNKNSWS